MQLLGEQLKAYKYCVTIKISKQIKVCNLHIKSLSNNLKPFTTMVIEKFQLKSSKASFQKLKTMTKKVFKKAFINNAVFVKTLML